MRFNTNYLPKEAATDSKFEDTFEVVIHEILHILGVTSSAP